MADEGYEVMGPGPGAAATGAPAKGNSAIPAFPVSSGGPAAPPPTAGGIPQFPDAGSTSGTPESKHSGMDNKKAVSMQEKPSGMEEPVENKKSKKSESQYVGDSKEKTKKSMSTAVNPSDPEESRMDGAPMTTQRPNNCDTLQLALIIFLGVLIIAIAIPVILTASMNADIGFLKDGIMKLPPKQ